MEIRTLGSVSIGDNSGVAEARRFAAGLARGLEFDEAGAGKLGIIVTEAGTNLLKYAGGGEIIFNALDDQHRHGIDMLALDKGPGIPDVAEALRDGHSTAGSPGTGLGAIRRLAADFEIYSRPSMGTALLARLWAGGGEPALPPIRVGAVAVPMPGESVSGDAWAVRRDGPLTSILVADGLGHGINAAEASSLAVHTFEQRPAPPGEVLDAMHQALRPTRGAAVALAQIDLARREVRFVGVGNISAAIIGPERERNIISHNGTLGHEVHRIQESVYEWPDQAVLILHTDGVSRRWDLSNYPGLVVRRPAIVAGVLYRDFKRDRDDVTVVVARDASGKGR